jgi:uncharacterized protein YdaU (DUF1376 family)
MLQHGAYTLLIDACYDREVFPTLRDAIDWTWASTKEEVEAVEFVLTRFFDLENGVYSQKRIANELAKYHETAVTNKRIAIEREAKRRQSLTDGERSVNEASPDVNEPPPNHKPLTKNHKPDIQKIQPPEGVGLQVWADYLAHRKTKKSPVTQTVVDGLIADARKAGLTTEQAIQLQIKRGWTGFDPSWVTAANQPVGNRFAGAI